MHKPILHAATSRKSIVLLSSLIAFFLLFEAKASAQNKFMGSGTCASSNCHGSVSPRSASNVLQNEYTTWFKNGAHAQAWRVLTNSDSKKIAAHLGIKSPESDPLCLKCHATYVPNSSLRGPKYRIRDGVGCESCHGAAENYLASHTSRTSSHKENVSKGLIDLVSLNVRARVCLDCHYGNDDSTVNHRLIGAGHPRLTYELDTYGILQPNHWEVDEDYVKRKAPYNSARAWAYGQYARSKEMIAQMSSSKRSKHGIMPELTLFNCYNCHHSLTEDQWKSRSYKGHPGELQLNISSLQMLALALSVLDPKQGESFSSKLKQLPAKMVRDGAADLIASLKSDLDGGIKSSLASAKYNRGVAKQLMVKVVEFSANNRSLPYEIAEQSAMAMSALSAAIGAEAKSYTKNIDAIYKSLENEEAFSPQSFSKAAKSFRAKLK